MTDEDKDVYYESILAGAVTFLVEGNEHDAASSVLLSCTIERIDYGTVSRSGDDEMTSVSIRLRGPRVACDVINDKDHAVAKCVDRALQNILPHGQYLRSLDVRMTLAEVDAGWRSELTEIARGKGVHNQATATASKAWRGLRFRSVSEIRIAEALDRVAVLFFPLCLGRLTEAGQRKTREPDFLVCEGGKWGILEVDGEPFHPPQRAVQDHQRDRLFKAHGVRIVEHYDATECYEQPDSVVAGFLELLQRS